MDDVLMCYCSRLLKLYSHPSLVNLTFLGNTDVSNSKIAFSSHGSEGIRD